MGVIIINKALKDNIVNFRFHPIIIMMEKFSDVISFTFSFHTLSRSFVPVGCHNY
jgi:hypothetical protein